METEHLIDFLSVLAVIVGIIGTVLPILPGVTLCFAGVLVYNYFGSGSLPLYGIIILGVLTVVSWVMEYIISAKQLKKYGGSKYGTWGGIIGAVIGFFIPIPVIGILLGMFLGVYVGELLYEKSNPQRAGRALKGAFIGFLYGTGFNLIIGLSMLMTVLFNLIQKFI